MGGAFAREPELVLLDEPTTGLDAGARRALWEELRRAGGTGETILTSAEVLGPPEG